MTECVRDGRLKFPLCNDSGSNNFAKATKNIACLIDDTPCQTCVWPFDGQTSVVFSQPTGRVICDIRFALVDFVCIQNALIDGHAWSMPQRSILTCAVPLWFALNLWFLRKSCGVHAAQYDMVKYTTSKCSAIQWHLLCNACMWWRRRKGGVWHCVCGRNYLHNR